MNINDALPKLIEIIAADEYHANYERTIEVANDGRIFTTGDGIDEKITSVRTRESKQQKEQRVRITKPLAPVSVEMIKKYFRKLRKTDGVKKNAKWRNENQTAKRNLETALMDFYAGQTVESYLFDVLEDYTFLDPNAFLVINRENVIDEQGRITGVRVYPTEYPSETIRHYQYRHGILDWLLIEEKTTEVVRRMEQDVSEFRMYGPGWVLHVLEYVAERPNFEGYTDTEIAIQGTTKSRYFVYRMYENGTTEVPAIRLGAYLDGRTKSKTAITPMEPVKPLVEKLISIGSLHDLTVFLHSIPRRKELVEQCNYHDNETGYYCESGWLTKDTPCPRCKGTGDKSITSEQDMIRILLPANFTPDDIPDLAKMAHTESADVDLLRWQQEKIDWLMKFIVYATMTRDAVTMAEVSRTATEMVLNNQEAYDKIQPYAELYSQAYMLIARVTAQYQDAADGLMVSHHFPDDYQFETESELLDKLEKAKNNGAPYDYLSRLKQMLIRRQTRSVEEAERAKAWDKWLPWPDMSDEMLSLLLTDRDPRDPKRVLRENYYQIRTEIEQETNGLFYLLAYDRQREVIEAKVAEVTEATRFRSVDPVDFEIDQA